MSPPVSTHLAFAIPKGGWLPSPLAGKIAVLFGALLLHATGCGDGRTTVEGSSVARRGAPPPPAASSTGPVTCTRTALTDALAKDFLPPKLSGKTTFCLDPKEPDTSYGAKASEPLEKIADLYDGESKVYEDFGADHVVDVRYVAEAGGAASLALHATRFNSAKGAYAMYTKRVVTDGDPATDVTSRSTDAGGAQAVLGVGNAYVWKGSWLVEIVYNDDTLSTDQLEKVGTAELAGIVKEIGAKLPGDSTVPPEIAALPGPSRLPLGLRLLLAAPFPGIAGDPDHPSKDAVPGGVGYYKDGDKRYRVSVVEAADEAAAKALLATASKSKTAKPLAGIGEEALELTWNEGPLLGRSVTARKGKRIVAVYDELRVLRDGMKDDERAKQTLTAEEMKKKLGELI